VSEFDGGNRTDLTQQATALTGPQVMTTQEAMMESPWTRPAPGEPMGAFSPGSPVLPLESEEHPRVFEYRVGYNLIYTPRAGYGLASFAMLRALAASCQEVRLNIELIKREVRALEWDIVPIDEQGGAGGLSEVKAFFGRPDRYMEFDRWTNALLEELLAIDAVALYPRRQRDGRLYALDGIAGDTIKPLLDFRGRTPSPPVPAFTQVLYGYPLWYGSRESLLYRPFNPSVTSPYGTSPIEFIILAVNLALRRTTLQVSYLSEGNIPEALIGAPASWTQKQIEDWQTWWDALITGKPAQQARIKWVPQEGGRGALPVYEFRKTDIDATARDTWLMQVACWAYGNNPAEFGLVPGGGLGGKGFIEGMENIQYRSILGPLTQYLAALFTSVIQRWLGRPNLQFKWVGMDPKRDAVAQAQLDQIYVPMGVYTLEYVQEREGIPPQYRGQPPSASSGLAPDMAALLGGGFPPQQARPEQSEWGVGGAPVAKFFREGGWEDYG